MLSLTHRLSQTFLALGLAAGAVFSSISPAQAQEFVSIKTTTAHVREKPAARAPSLWELGAGYPLQVTQRKNGWLRVKDHEATLGWVHAPQTHKKPHMVITARSAQLRAGPGTQHKPLAKLDQHEVVRTLKKSGDWAQVQREGGQKGWILRRLAWGW